MNRSHLRARARALASQSPEATGRFPLLHNAPFRVADPSQGKLDCLLGGVTPLAGDMNEVQGYDLEAGIAGESDILFFLVTADNGPGTEGPLGDGRTADARCAR